MVRISILYPYVSGCRFDLAYYAEKHMPWAIDLLSRYPGYRGVSVERGIGAGAAEPHFIVTCHFLFDSMDCFNAAFEPNQAALRADIPNYTDIEPCVQFSEVVMSS